jgi:hypothetical protein
MRLPVKRTAPVLAGLAMLAGTAGGTTFVGMNERVLTRAADAIVVGTVERIETVGADGAINTLVTLAVEDVYKGTLGRRITLKQPGGRLGGRILWIAGSPRFRLGERQLLFLSAHRDGSARTTAFGMGQFSLRRHRRTGALLAERQLDAHVLGERPLRRLPLARLLRTIRRAAAEDAGRSPAPLLAAPPELTAPDLERVPVAEFTFMDSPSGRWSEPDSGAPVVYEVAGADAAIGASASIDAIDRALAAWTNVSGATITLQRGATTVAVPLTCDDVSQIVFGDPFREMPNPIGCSGVLALGGYCTSSTTSEVNGVRFYRITEGNITFNQGFGACAFWNATNLAEVATHELGHTIGIGHSSEEDDAPPDLKDATMYYRAHFDGRGASVHADDVAAVRAIYPGPGESDPAREDSDGDGFPDLADNCAKIPNTAQTDADGDGVGDLCDPCPLVAGGEGTCEPIYVSTLKIRLAGARSRLLWRGSLDLPPGVSLAAARVLLVNASGIVLDSTMGSALTRAAAHAPGRRSLRYRSGHALITLRPGPGGSYQVRVAARRLALDTSSMPLISANLQVGSAAFADSLSCSHRRRRLVCRG